jgi:DNA repair protein RecN (Recombination protein N)
LEALFQIPATGRVADVMADLGYDAREGLLVRRIISSSDRHRIYINDRLATMGALTAITAHLASISGQHAHQGLLKEEEHLFVLDQYGGLLPLRQQYQKGHRQLVPLIRKAQELLRQQARQGEQMALLQFQQQEIEAAQVVLGEDGQLEQERLRLKNGETLFQTATQCVDELYSQDGAVVERLGQLGQALSKAGQIDPQLKQRGEELATLTYGVEDLVENLRGYLGRIDLDPHQLDAVDERLHLLNKLKRKYGGSLEAVLAHAGDIADQLGRLENIDAAIRQVQGELADLHTHLGGMARELSEKRHHVAGKLARHVEHELGSLKMGDTRFAVDLQPVSADPGTSPDLSYEGHCLTETGTDRAAFMMAPNVGEAIKPLAGIASGGELSRVVLALKAILAQSDSVETVVFDEVDAGIGGAVAEVVGQKLAALALHHQIICITHLPQIACYGQRHLYISKAVTDGRTSTTIRPLAPPERVEEIARMLGGQKITVATLTHAQEMLAGAISRVSGR